MTDVSVSVSDAAMKQLQRARKHAIAVMAVRACIEAKVDPTCKQVEARPEWQAEFKDQKCAGPILGEAKEDCGLEVTHNTRTAKELPEPSIEDYERAVTFLVKHFGGDPTRGVAFMQELDETFGGNPIASAPFVFKHTLESFEQLNKWRAIDAKMKQAGVVFAGPTDGPTIPPIVNKVPPVVTADDQHADPLREAI